MHSLDRYYLAALFVSELTSSHCKHLRNTLHNHVETDIPPATPTTMRSTSDNSANSNKARQISNVTHRDINQVMIAINSPPLFTSTRQRFNL
ncbi:hypothetical protein AVEN_227643-1 [Araneus ventricosus]|uniref:Uncharacterized protein n=1 Tax=Araneus ventricosus TaxID=182803 RepID=A0A4Y2TWX5_ARAVE|nr:hypothetical protein AVEN_227643-1 [Araneus ventricosus]